jgi:hypothetical protein
VLPKQAALADVPRYCYRACTAKNEGGGGGGAIRLLQKLPKTSKNLQIAPVKLIKWARADRGVAPGERSLAAAFCEIIGAECEPPHTIRRQTAGDFSGVQAKWVEGR